MTTLRDWLRAIDALYDPAWAEDWDAVGLVTGDPDQRVDRAVFAVDPDPRVIDEAEQAGAQLVVAHHPLLLHGVHGVPETSTRGRLLARLVRSRVALVTAHTNADVAAPGVSDALADAIGVRDTLPLHPVAPGDAVKLVVFVPTTDVERLVDALAAAGAGGVGDYTRCYWATAGTGSFVPQPGADPAVGEVGQQAQVDEHRVEMLVPTERVAEAVRALRATHPYEEPAFDLLPTMIDHGRGFGRVGELAEPMTGDELAAHVARCLPASANAVRLAGDANRVVRRVAACGGAGDDFVGDAIAAGADVYVTADLRHHVVGEAVERGLLMVDAGHWATEWPWASAAAQLTQRALRAAGHTVVAAASALVTDPWTAAHAADS